MKKKLVLILMAIVIILSPISNKKVLADDFNVDLGISKEVLVEDLTVNILQDGRVSPVENSHKLSEEKLDLILQRIGYPKDSISRWDIDRKIKPAGYGGKVLEGNVSQFKEEYIDNNGKSYEITPFNKMEIRNIQLEDLKELGIVGNEVNKYNIIKEDTSLMEYGSSGFKKEGIWSGDISVAYVGGTSTQNKYIFIMDYYWDENPYMNFTDCLGMAWGGYGQPVGGTASAGHAINDSRLGWQNFDHDIDVSSVDGITSKFRFPDDYLNGEQVGFLEEEVMVSKRYSGEQVSIAGAYGHLLVPGNASLSVLNGTLSFDIPRASNRWTWRYNFTVN